MAATIEEGLVAYLLADTAIKALVVDRISPWAGQGEALPRITYAVISTEDESVLAASSYQPKVRIQLDVWGQTRAQARALTLLVKNSKGGAGGSNLRDFGAASLGGIWVQSVDLENEMDGEDAPQDMTGRPVPRISLDLLIAFKEP